MNGTTVTLVGNLVGPPELRYAAGQAMASFGMAVNRRWQDRSTGEWHEDTSFFNCTCWRELAENVAESLHRGDRVLVSGRLQQRRWQTQSGDKRSTVEVQVDECGPSLRWAAGRVERTSRRTALGEDTAPVVDPPADAPAVEATSMAAAAAPFA